MDCCTGSIEPDDGEMLEHPNPEEAMKRKRSCTDQAYLFGMAVFFVVLFVLLGVSISGSGIDRLIHGYDDCGNICGMDNIKTDPTPECFGKDMTNNKYLLYQIYGSGVDKYITKTCVSNCKDHNAYIGFFNHCFPNSSKEFQFDSDNYTQELVDDLKISWKYIIGLTFLAFVFSIILMMLMRYATAFLVWFTLICISLLFVALTAYLWVLYNQAASLNNRDDSSLFLYLAIMATVFTIVFLLVILVMAKRIKLVIQLFKEAAKVIAAIPLILFQPVLTFLVICFILSMFIYTTLLVTSSGYLMRSFDETTTTKYDYFLSAFQQFSSWYNIVATLWIVQFVVGCQHIIISGCVATWFFTRNKNELRSPIVANTVNLIRYHLGTVALGSLIITIVQMIRLFLSYLRAAARRKNNIVMTLIWCLCSHIVQVIEEFLKYFTRNAYIMTAVYGYSFCASGKRALTLLVKNLFNVIAINSVGDYILFFMKLFVVVFTVFVGVEVFRENDQIKHLWLPLTCAGIIAYFIAHCFFTVIEMAIDTIFLCFCEDCEINDGYSKPYYMSRNLMEFIENSNKTVNLKNWTDTHEEAWRNGPKRIMLESS